MISPIIVMGEMAQTLWKINEFQAPTVINQIDL